LGSAIVNIIYGVVLPEENGFMNEMSENVDEFHVSVMRQKVS